MKRGIKKNRSGFTLVELLTTIVVIAILLAVLVPTFTNVQVAANTARQKAQFHGLGIALEAVYTDLGDYPTSAYDGSGGVMVTYGRYSSSQRLAEAVIGRDGFGVHRDTQWFMDGLDSPGGVDLYASGTYSKAERFGPYMELENANAVKLNSIYTGLTTLTPTDYVLVDMYKKAKNKITGKMGGMPILYYRANRSQTGHNPAAPSTWMNTYDVYDALGGPAGGGIASLDVPFTATVSVHPMKTAANATDYTWFYDTIQNPNFPGDPTTTIGRRPYRSDSFILHSAGPDGLYGTIDDVFNFDQDN